MLTLLAVAALFIFLQVPTGDVDPQQLAKIIFDGVTQRQWSWVAAAVVVGLVWAVRKYGAAIPKIGPYLAQHPMVGYALPFVIASGGAMLNALVAHQPVEMALLAGVDVAAKAIAAFIGFKKVTEMRALSAGAAIIAVPDKAAALSVLESAADENAPPKP